MAYFDTYAPFSHRDGNGAMAGLLIDTNSVICRSAGFATEHVGMPWARAQQEVQAGYLDAFCTNPTAHRRSYALFCEQPVVEARIGLFHLIENERVPSELNREDLVGLTLGDFIGNDWAKQNLSDLSIEWTATEETVFRKVARGRIDGFISQEITAYNKLRRLGISDRFAFTPTPFLGGFRFTFGLRRSFPDAERVVAEIDHATRLLRENGELDRLIKPFYG